MTRATLLAMLSAAGLMAACNDPVDELLGGRPDPNADSTTTGGAFDSPTNPAGDVGTVTLHRLNRSEYDNTVRDLLGDTSRPSSAFPPDNGSNSFTNNADALSISPLLFEKYEASAEKLAGVAIANKTIMTCDGASEPDSCAKQIIGPFLARAWRRPVTDEEVASIAGLVKVATSEGETFAQGVALAVKAALLSPNFLFRVEIDPDPASNTAHRLNDFELASRLSYFLWSSMPDDALFASAKSGKLATDKGELDAQVKRMLDDPKSRALLDNFASEWLVHGLSEAERDPAMFPTFDDDLRASMAEETKQLAGSFITGDASLSDMLDADYTFLNGKLATHYGVGGVTGEAFVRVPMKPETHRGGLLAQGSVLTMTSVATRTSPTRRGAWVLTSLLCSPPSPPPPSVPPLPSEASTGTTRERLEEHRKNPACAGCHAPLDPIGFAFENYDAIGRWRDAEQGEPVDATGKLPDGRTLNGVRDLARVIKDDPRFAKCATEKFFSYAVGRTPRDIDVPRVAALSKGFGDARLRARSLIVSIIQNDAFRMRKGGN